MKQNRKCSFTAALGASLALFLFGFDAAAQPADRITGAVDEQRAVRLAGDHSPYAIPRFDTGPADPKLAMNRMILTLQPDAAQQSAAAALIDALHDPNSPQYHHWLTPEEYAAQFGVSPNDVARVSEWLSSHGFRIEEVPAGNQSIIFSGTVAQVEQAFQTQIHRYRVNGEEHLANASDPAIPQALAAVVAGPVTLHNFRRKAMHDRLAPAPQYTYGGVHSLGPPDFATIYDLSALYTSNNSGSGQTIGIVGRINIQTQDIQEFRATWGLPANNPTIIVNGPNPGIYDMDDEAEADLDVEWSGGVAPLATVKFVVSESTNTTDGVDLSAQYIVSNNLANVMSTSFGSCEAAMGSAEMAFYSNLWQQAAAEGITAFIAAGDSGAAGCDAGSDTTAQYGKAVNGLCSSVYSVCVGGTELNEGGNSNLYWSATNNSTTLESALSYIPEVAWNDSGANGGSGLWATGGGASAYYSKPSWQSGPGVPSDGQRDVPDLSVTASGDHDPFWVVILDNYYSIGGTSAASPSMAGMMALIDEKNGGRQGNANTRFYALANAAASGGADVFHGTTGGNNSVPGLTGFTASAHYNQATGLGSPDGFVMANHWAASTPAAPSFTLTPSAATLTAIQGGHTTVNAVVAVSGGFSAAVALKASNLPGGVTASFAPASLSAPGSGTSVLTLTASSSAAAGSYTITLTASGGSVVKTATVNLTIAHPFTIAASAGLISINQGASGSLKILSSTSAGFSGAVGLTASSHAGVTAAFTPSTIASPGSGSSTLALAVAASAVPGTYTLTITGISGSFAETTTVSVTINQPPSFTLSLPVNTISLAPGGSATAQVSVIAVSGFKSTVTFSTGTLPSGMTAHFSGTTLTVQTTSSVAVGSHSIMILGSVGNYTAPAVTMIVNVGTFTLTVPSTATVTPGRALTIGIKTSVTNGFNGPIALSATGLPSSLVASFSPATITNPASGSGTMTLSPSSAILPGSFRMYVVGASGGATVTVPVTVTVP